LQPENELKTLLGERPEYRRLLYRRGYLVTDSEDLQLDVFPFFKQWSTRSLGQRNGRELSVVAHLDQRVTIREFDTSHLALIGHAYNPFTMELSEDKILDSLAVAWAEGREAFFKSVNELTGTFLLIVRTDATLLAVQDASGLKACFYGIISQRVYISSHPQLVADIQGLSVDPFIKNLVSTRMYNVGNRYLPGAMSPFKELKRLGGNTYLDLENSEFKVRRFFPVAAPPTLTSTDSVEHRIEQLAEILSSSIQAITKKWSRPAISLTGGTDSKTTLAAASEVYDELKFFSFESKPSEELDAEAAAELCRTLGLPHELYKIPHDNNSLTDYRVKKKIIDHNSNYFKNMADNEIRKMITLEQRDDFDVEIKSWSSEIVRVFMERKYSVQMPEKLTPRHFSIFQTRYFGTPNLLKRSDEVYEEFIRDTQFDEASELYEASDLYYWEVRLGAWGSSVVSVFDYCHEVTVPYNNRRFLELFMSLPREMRKRDKAHLEIIKLKQPKIAMTGIDVRNRYFHSYRQIMEKAYYVYRIAAYSLKRHLSFK